MIVFHYTDGVCETVHGTCVQPVCLSHECSHREHSYSVIQLFSCMHITCQIIFVCIYLYVLIVLGVQFWGAIVYNSVSSYWGSI